MKYLFCVLFLFQSVYDWDVSYSYDKFENKKITILSQRASKPIRNLIGMPVYPEMVIRVVDDKMDIFLDTHRYMGGIEYTTDNYKCRTENGILPRITDYSFSTDKTAFFFNDLTYTEWVEIMKSNKELVWKIDTYQSSSVTIIFKLKGFKEAFNKNIRPLVKPILSMDFNACKKLQGEWKMNMDDSNYAFQCYIGGKFETELPIEMKNRTY